MNWQIKSCILLVFTLVTQVAFAQSSSPLHHSDGPLDYDSYYHRNWNTRDNLPQVSVMGIAQDHQGFIWVATENGLARFDGYQFEVFDSEDSPVFSNPLLKTLYFSSDNTLWIGSSNRLISYQDNTFKNVRYNEESLGAIYAITEFNGSIFAGGTRLYRLALNTHQIQQAMAMNEPVTALLARDDKLWVATAGSLSYLTSQGILQSVPLKEILGDQPFQISSLAWFEGSLLVGTSRGLFRLDSDNRLVPFKLAGESFNGSVSLLFTGQHHELWVSISQQLLQIKNGEVIGQKDKNEPRSSAWYVSAFEDAQGFLWLGSRTQGLQRLRIDGTRQFGLDAGLHDPFTWSVLKADNGDILVGTNSGLYRWEANQFQRVMTPEHLPNPAVYSLMQDSRRDIWVGTRSGLITVDERYQKVRSYPAVSHSQINGVIERENGEIWVATLDGLFILNGEKLIDKTKAIGLPEKNIRMLAEDAENHVWIATASGLFRYKNGKLTEFAKDEALSGGFVTFVHQLNDGRIIAGTFQSGLAVLDEHEWHWISAPEIPSNDVMFAGEYNGKIVVSSLKGIYQFPLSGLAQGNTPAVEMLIDDFGLESDIDGLRCCNGAGNSKGLIVDHTLLVPSLNGLVSVDLNADFNTPSNIYAFIEGLQAGDKWYLGDEIRLPLGQRNLRLSYTSPVFYRNSALRFRYQLEGYEAGWSNPTTRRDAFYTKLPAGEYTFYVQVKMTEDTKWSERAKVHLTVPAYWYEQTWTHLLAGLLILGLLWAVWQQRVKQLEKSRYRLQKMVDEKTRELQETNVRLAQANEQLKAASLTDALTGLHNRRYLDLYIDSILARSERLERGAFCILLDIDNFKRLNDGLGHAVGDDILVAFGGLIRRQIRSADHLVRWGGEEFLLILDTTVAVGEFLERLLESVAQADWPHQASLPEPISFSAGVSYHLPGKTGWDWDTTLVLADKAMYLVKQNGKAGWLQLQMKPTVDDMQNVAKVVTRENPESLIQSGYFLARGSAHVVSAFSGP